MGNIKKTKVVGDNGLTFTAEAKNSTVTLDIIKRYWNVKSGIPDSNKVYVKRR